MTDENRTVLRTLPLGRYREYRPVGEGGMGIVYWAMDTDLNREVALKIVRPALESIPDGKTPEQPIGIPLPEHDSPASKAFETLRNRFLQEAWITGGMAHPGIVPVYELGQTPEGIPYYTMRFVKGNRTLATAMEDVRDRPAAERLTLLEPFLKVCDAISYAHAHGVIHRDLKPENVALGEFGEVVVLDWGLAKTREGPDAAGSRWQERIREYREAKDLKTLAGAMGTPGYMSPEAALGEAEEVDERSDVYSLGVVLYQILTGRLPFPFESFIELIRRMRDEDPPRPHDLDPEIPTGISDLCARTLSRVPGERPASAEVLAREVREWQARLAEDEKVAGWLREARGALDGAAGLTGENLLPPLDQAGAASSQVLSIRPGDPTAVAVQEEVGRLRERGIAERERSVRRRLLQRGGVVLLVVATIVTIVFATVLEGRLQRAEDAERVAARERDEKDVAFRRAEGLRLAAESRTVLAADAGLGLALAVEAGKLHRGPQVRNALQAAVRIHRGRWSLPGRCDLLRISPDSRFLATQDGRDTRVFDLETREVAAHIVEQRFADISADGSRMATAHDSGVSVWNTRKWELVIEIETGPSFPGAHLSPDGAYVLTRGDASGRNVTLWDVRTGRWHRTLEGHTGEVRDASFTEDGARLLTVSQADRTTRVWSVATGAALLVIRGDDDDLDDVGPDGERDTTATAGALFTMDGSRIVTLSATGIIRLWDAGNGDRLETLEGISRNVFPLVRAKNRDRFLINTLTALDENLFVWEPRTSRRIPMRPSPRQGVPGSRAILSADGDRVLQFLSLDRVMRVYSADSGEELQVLPDADIAEFSPDGRWIVAASRDGGAITRQGARTREESGILDLTLTGGIDSAWLSTDGERLTTFGREDRTAIVRDVETGRILSTHTARDGSWGRPSPDGSVAVLWSDRQPGRLAEVSTGRTLTDLSKPNELEAIAFSHDGRFLAAGIRLHSLGVHERMRIVETATGRVAADIARAATAAAFDRTGTRVAVAFGSWVKGIDGHPQKLEVFDLEAGKSLWSLELPPGTGGEILEGISLDADSDRLLAWSDAYTRLFDVGTNQPRWTTGNGTAPIRWAGLSADGERVGILSDDLRVLDAATGDLLFSVPRPAIVRGGVRWSPHGRRLLTADEDGAARVRDGDSGKVVTTLRGHEMPLLSAEYSADGGRIVTVSFDQTAKVWDATSGRELLDAGGHAGEHVRAFRFVPDTGHVLIGTSGRRAELRDPADWSLVARYFEPVSTDFVDPSGSHRRTYTVGKSTRVLAATGGEALRTLAGSIAQFGPAARRVFTRDPDGTERIFDVRTRAEIAEPWTDADRRRFMTLRGGVSPDGRWLLDLGVSSQRSEHASRARVLAIETGAPVAQLEGHAGSITSARFGPAGRLVVTASVDRTARVWDVATATELMSLDHSDEVRDAAISPDGTFFVTLSGGKLRRFPIDPFAVAESLGPRPLTDAERRRFELEVPAGSPPTPSEPGAGLRLYESLIEELGDEAKVRERLARDDSLDPAARAAAAKIRFRARDHARRLSRRAFRISVVPGKTPDEYAEALRLARTADRLRPDDPAILADLAKAMIRTGSAEEGVAALDRVAPARARALGRGIPTDAAFLALGYHALGREEEARSALAKCRELVRHADFAAPGSRAILVPLLREVEERLK